MKKKIKDLTIEEIKNICIKANCNNCPLDIPELWCKHNDLYEYGEEEIEVEDDD